MAKTTERLSSISPFYTKRNSKSPANKAEKWVGGGTRRSRRQVSRVKQGLPMPVDDEDDVNATIPLSPPFV